ncbi:MAG: type II toxin-antitoxin system HicA family toxin [Chitinophagales bacterium]
MSRLPVTTSKKLEKILLHLGFIIVRQKGSHVFYRHPDGRYTTLPHHAGEDLGRSLTRQILREIQISPELFIQLLNEV